MELRSLTIRINTTKMYVKMAIVFFIFAAFSDALEEETSKQDLVPRKLNINVEDEGRVHSIESFSTQNTNNKLQITNKAGGVIDKILAHDAKGPPGPLSIRIRTDKGTHEIRTSEDVHITNFGTEMVMNDITKYKVGEDRVVV